MPKLEHYLAESNRKAVWDILPQIVKQPTTEVNPHVKALLNKDDYEYQLINADTISEAFSVHEANPNAKIAILNFSSYKTPGGGFLSDMIAQEEAICYCTNLYPELDKFRYSWYAQHQSSLHYGLYENQSLLSHDITVVAKQPGQIIPKEDFFTVDVMTCAAPNWTCGLRYGSVPMNKLREATFSRIDYVLSILSAYEYDDVILGAYGCGVFKNDPTFVAHSFTKCMQKYNFKHITFAIPDSNSENFLAFKRVLFPEA